MFKNLTIKKKLIISFCSIVTFAISIISAISYFAVNDYVRKRGMEGIVLFVENNQKNLNHSIESSINHIKKDIEEIAKAVDGKYLIDSSKKLNLDIENQITQDKKKVEIAEFLFNGVTLYNSNHQIVDSFKNSNGNHTTIFQVIPEGLLRISTSIERADRTRAIGTYIPSESPVYKKIVNGEDFFGHAKVLNRWYVTAYKPLFDKDKKVIGAIFSGMEDEAFYSIAEWLKTIRIGESGYPYIIDMKGNIITHPKLEGQNFYDKKDVNGFSFIQEIIKNKNGTVEYSWENINTKKIEKKIVSFRYLPDYDWILAVGEDFSDFEESAWGIVKKILISGLFILIISIFAGLYLSFNISSILDKLLSEFTFLKDAAHREQFTIRADERNIHPEFQPIIRGLNEIFDFIVKKIFWFEAIIDSFPFPVCVSNSEQKIDLINTKMEKKFNLTKKDAIGKNGDVVKKRLYGENNYNRAMNADQLTFEFDDKVNNEIVQVDVGNLKNLMNEIIGKIEIYQDITPKVRVAKYNQEEINKISNNLKKLSTGDLNLNLIVGESLYKETQQAREHFLLINNDLTTVKNALQMVTEDSRQLIKNAKEGNLNINVQATKHQGVYREIVDGINDIFQNLLSPLYLMANYLEKLSEGKELDQIKETFSGDYEKIRININNVCIVIKNTINSINFIIDSVIKGKLEDRINHDKMLGFWKQNSLGINQILNETLKPINEATAVIREMSNGNLCLRMRGEYHGDHTLLKNALNTSLDAIAGSLNEVMLTVNQVSDGSGKLASTSATLSQGATEQASSLEEITSTMNQIGSQVNKNALNANQAKTLSESSQESAKHGHQQMKNMLDAMANISNSSNDIAKIIKVIDEIAFQTNLLALNAAVEAARAGKHGKGFAVVAEEVRNLAARSATAAKETTSLIADSLSKVQNGSVIAGATGKSLEDILNKSSKVADLVNEIAEASTDQANSVSQIVSALGQISQVTQKNVMHVQESASIAEKLSDEANELNKQINSFKLN